MSIEPDRNHDMKLRITTTTEGAKSTVKVHGNLRRGGVAEIETLCSSLEGELVLDLEDLLHADDSGIEALRRIRDSGVELLAVPRYVELLLASEDA